MEVPYSMVNDRKPKKMLQYMDPRLIELFGLYEYKPSPKARVAYLGTEDADLVKWIERYGYKVRASGANFKTGLEFWEFKVDEWNWWKIRKIIFKLMRVKKGTKTWGNFFREELGADWESWAFILRYDR